MILLIGDRDDPHLIELQETISAIKNSPECKLLSTTRRDLLKTNFLFYADKKLGLSCIIEQAETKINLKSIKIAFCLLPIFRLEGDEKEEDQVQKFWRLTWRESLQGIYLLLSEKNMLVNKSIHSSVAAQNKIIFFEFARKAGLLVPQSIVSNDKGQIVDFIGSGGATVLKTMHQMSLEVDDEQTMLLVQKVTRNDFSDFSSDCECPIFLQHYVEKSYDVRVIVIGQQFLACKIDASRSIAGNVDWRAYDLPNTPHEIIEVSYDLRIKLGKLMASYELDYACIDFCVDKNDCWWILDVNPFGRNLWIEYATGLPILNTMASYLISRAQQTI